MLAGARRLRRRRRTSTALWTAQAQTDAARCESGCKRRPATAGAVRHDARRPRKLTVTAATAAAVPLNGPRAADRGHRAKRQEPFRDQARSRRAWPHRCAHRRRPPRPAHLASDGRETGNAGDAASGTRRNCSARSTMPDSRPATAGCNSACATSPSSGQNTGNETGRNAQRLIISRRRHYSSLSGGTNLRPHVRIGAAASTSGSRRRT